MQFYKLWHKDNERGTNYLVAAEDTAEAKQLLVDHLNEIANFHSLEMFHIGYASKRESDWITVWKEEDCWGWFGRTKMTAWEEWQECKRDEIKKVITEFKP